MSWPYAPKGELRVGGWARGRGYDVPCTIQGETDAFYSVRLSEGCFLHGRERRKGEVVIVSKATVRVLERHE